ncbi:hypothetical protein IAU60_002883 [Kwoniella sp. DSM 27419]
MLHLSSAPPTTISLEEHATITSSTPTSFVDIPPVLRWVDDVEVTMSSTSGGWESWSHGRIGGKLYVTEASVAFIPAQTTPGFDLPFPSLTLHALTPASGGEPAHLYCQVDESDAPLALASGAQTNGAAHVNEDEDEDEDEADQGADEYTEMREIRVYLPEAKLEPLFSALSFCSALHASLLPSGEPSSFFGFGGEDSDGGEDGQWEDADVDIDGGEDEDMDGDIGTDGGRVRSDFHSGGGPGARFRPY